MRRVAALALLPLLLAGCRAPPVDEVGILAPDYEGLPIEVLATDVVGEDCVGALPLSRRPSYRRAVAAALAQVEGASAMQRVSLQYQNRLFERCARVRGDAGRPR